MLYNEKANVIQRMVSEREQGNKRKTIYLQAPKLLLVAVELCLLAITPHEPSDEIDDIKRYFFFKEKSCTNMYDRVFHLPTWIH